MAMKSEMTNRKPFMRSVWMKTFLSFTLVLVFASQSFAQSAVGEEKSRPGVGGPRRQLATILFTGLGGAILGLSTLSFYGRPQDKLSNIAIGFAFGVIVGTGYVTYKAATDPRELYGVKPMIETEFEQAARREVAPPTPLVFNYAFEF